MGVSWRHDVWFICDKNETDWLNNLPDRVPGLVTDTPVFDKNGDGRVVSFTSDGYNIFDLFGVNFPRPDSWTNCVHRISPCQGQDFDVVDWVGREEIEEIMSECEVDEDGELESDYRLTEYVDPSGEYWREGNPHLNVYNTENELWSTYYNERYTDDCDEDELQEQFYDWFSDYVRETQTKDINQGLSLHSQV